MKRRKESNLEKYGLTDEERGAIVIPVLREDETTSVFVGSSVKGTDGLATTAAKMEQIMMLQVGFFVASLLREGLAWPFACFLTHAQTHTHTHAHTNTRTRGHTNKHLLISCSFLLSLVFES